MRCVIYTGDTDASSKNIPNKAHSWCGITLTKEDKLHSVYLKLRKWVEANRRAGLRKREARGPVICEGPIPKSDGKIACKFETNMYSHFSALVLRKVMNNFIEVNAPYKMSDFIAIISVFCSLIFHPSQNRI